MSMGDGLLVQALEAMRWPTREVKRVAAALLLVSMVLASFLLAAQDVTALPAYRVTAINNAYQLTGWPQ